MRRSDSNRWKNTIFGMLGVVVVAPMAILIIAIAEYNHMYFPYET